MANKCRPRGLHWRSKPSFILTTVAFGLFTDLFLYAIVVPVLPFMLLDRFYVPENEIQLHVSRLLAAYAGASVLSSIPVGWIVDKIGSRQPSFLAGLILLSLATTLFAFGQSIPVLMLARCLQGMSAAVVWTTGFAMIQDTVGPGQLGQVIGTILSFTSVGELIAPVLGGIIYDAAGFNAVFFVATGILAIDLCMRLFVIDNKAVADYSSSQVDECSVERASATRARPAEEEAREDDLLLPKDDNRGYKIQGDPGRVSRVLPILYCFLDPSLLMAMILSFVQASLLGILDATVPTEAAALFHFSSLKAGLLFIPLIVPYLALGHTAGLAVDRYGTKAVATAGYTFLIPTLALLGLPSQGIATGNGNILLFCAVLALNGVGLAIVNSPGFVEASSVMQKYEAANPGFFGEHGPYAQLYAFNSLFFSGGFTVGPLLGGMLRDKFGYGIMGVAAAVLSGVTALLSFSLIGKKRQ